MTLTDVLNKIKWTEIQGNAMIGERYGRKVTLTVSNTLVDNPHADTYRPVNNWEVELKIAFSVSPNWFRKQVEEVLFYRRHIDISETHTPPDFYIQAITFMEEKCKGMDEEIANFVEKTKKELGIDQI